MKVDDESRGEAIAELENRRKIFIRREARRPGLWSEEIRDCDIMLARLRSGLPLTCYQRGLPSDGGGE